MSGWSRSTHSPKIHVSQAAPNSVLFEVGAVRVLGKCSALLAGASLSLSPHCLVPHTSILEDLITQILGVEPEEPQES